MITMLCSYFRRHLPAYANDEIEAGRLRQWVERHVARCHRCASELEAFTAMRGLVVAARTEKVASAGPSWDSVWARIDQRRAAAVPRRGFTLRPALAVAAVFAICAGLWLAWPRARDVVVQPRPPAVGPSPTPVPIPPHDVVANGTEKRGSGSSGVTSVPHNAVAKSNTHLTHPKGHRGVRVADSGPNGRAALDWLKPTQATIAVELSPNTHTGSVDAAVVNKDASSCVIDT